MITPKKWALLKERMLALHINEDDINEKFILGSGHGGQKLQKTASCVSLQHKSSGITIKCQDSRLRDSNRFFARRRLCDKIEEILYQKKSAKQQKIEKIKRQKRRRSRRAKEKILTEKHRQSTQKSLRKKPDMNE